MRTLVIWYNRNKDCYYYRFLSILPKVYRVGYVNQYNHEIVLLISSKEVQPVVIKKYISIRKGLCEILIRFFSWLGK